MLPMLSAEGGSSASGIIAGALSGVDLTVITTEILSIVPMVLPVALTLLAVRKGLNFLFGTLRGA